MSRAFTTASGVSTTKIKILSSSTISAPPSDLSITRRTWAGQCKRPRSPQGPEPLLIGIAATSDPAKLVGRSLHRPEQPVYGRASEKTHSWQAATHMRSALHSPRVMIPSAFGGLMSEHLLLVIMVALTPSLLAVAWLWWRAKCLGRLS